MTNQNDNDDDLGLGDLATPSLPRTSSTTEAAAHHATDTSRDEDEGDLDGDDEGDDEGDLSETGVREHPVDAVLSETAAANLPELTEAELFTHQVRDTFDKSI